MKNYKVSDNKLIAQYIKGDKKSFEELLGRHSNKIYNYILLTIKDQHLAEDIFQDTFIKVINSLKEGKYRDDGKFIYWVMRIAHNLIIDHFRKEKQLNSVSGNNYESKVFNSKKYSVKDFEEEIIEEQISEDVKNLIDFLPNDQKEVIILRHFLGLSFKEIATHTDVSINTALGRMRYALLNLRKLVEENNIVLTK